ncbi:uncharacterized protein F5891DRAFT_1280887 [Suillus fuscotomentosus]|uniref:Uncharacterized protein n=1 Tax=Suillus fuscotomentosus TaxID=1912939 RepID=A0AAD4DYI6_9AGAM|nr:uncharacterized protein F5891DRAFT_1280887 [Suillus fuscotomentosus]KAG1895997.1 hypothetical protein F5891DRAFT_1280887 [Suillus fuscotomentosus]
MFVLVVNVESRWEFHECTVEIENVYVPISPGRNCKYHAKGGEMRHQRVGVVVVESIHLVPLDPEDPLAAYNVDVVRLFDNGPGQSVHALASLTVVGSVPSTATTPATIPGYWTPPQAASHEYYGLEFSSRNTVNATAIWAADSDIVMRGSSPRQYPLADPLPDFHQTDPGPNEPDPGLNEPDLGPNESNPDLNQPAHELDDIKVEHHPHSQIPSTMHHFSEFSCSCPTEDYVPRNDSPWEPFRTRLDFEVAEIALEAAMTKDQTNRLLNLIHRSASGNDTFTLQNHDEVCSLWDLASQCYTRSQLPPDAKPLAFILYAHKSKLSSFGSQKGYPIIAHIDNLLVHICNSNTALGGGHVVGWLPIIVEDQEHAKKKNYVDFKNAVWHTSFYQLLALVAKHSNTGYWFECGDGIRRHLWPLILILSADYEEQCIMALIRGLKGKFPCPNVFSRILHVDVHRALSFNRLHTNEEGLWGDHLWKEVKFWILDLGHEAAVKLDKNFDELPRWPNLTHFSSVVAVDFTNGSVLGDLSKMIVFAAQDILTSSHCKLGQLLLHCIHYYVEFDIYVSLEVHTEDTIAAGRLALQKFSEMMDEYIAQSHPETNKNWNFPKKHLVSHAFDDILAKGNVASQILHYDEWLLTSTSMCSELDELDKYNQQDTCDPETNEVLDDSDAGTSKSTTIHAHLGSRQGNNSFSDIMHLHGTDRAFTNFRMKLNNLLNGFLPQNNIPLPDGRHIHMQAEHTITEFRFLRINYESLVDWCMHQDLLRCNPKFYGSPRYDCVIVNTANTPFFARLVYMFTCLVGSTEFPLALIQPYDVSIANSHQRRDNDMGLWRVRAKPCSSSEIISVWSIVRGAALARNPKTDGDYFVIHTVDTDMFLRVKALQASAQPL